MKSFKMIMFMLVFFPICFMSSVFADYSGFLYPREVEASSYLYENTFKARNNYHSYYVLDDNPKTAWVEGNSGDGIGEYIMFYGLSIPKANKVIISIRNGYQKSEDLFTKNNRIKELEVSIRSGPIGNEKLDSIYYTLKDKIGWQDIEFSPIDDVISLKFIIKSVYKGTIYQDTCISDLKIRVSDFSFVKQNEQKEFQNYFNYWFQRRNEKAAFFNNLPKNYPFEDYIKKTYEMIVSNEELNGNFGVENLGLYDKVFKNTEWNQYSSKAYNGNISQMFSGQLANKNVYISFKNEKMFFPDILSELIFNDICKYIDLSGITIHKAANVNKSRELLVGLQNGKIRKIFGGYEYYYDNNGKLLCIIGERDEGEYFNAVFLMWEKSKVVKMFLIKAEFDIKGTKFSLKVYQSKK